MNATEIRRASNLLAKLTSQQDLLEKLRSATEVSGLRDVQIERSFEANANSKFGPVMTLPAIATQLGVTERRVGEAFVRALIQLAAENVGKTRYRLNDLGIEHGSANANERAAA